MKQGNPNPNQGMFDEAIRAFEDSLMEDRASPISPLYLPYISPISPRSSKPSWSAGKRPAKT